MTTVDAHYFFSIPDWQTGSGRRLSIAMLLASILIVAGLSAIRIPVAGEPVPLAELVVRLIENATEPATDTEQNAANEALLETSVAPQTETLPDVSQDPPADPDTIQPIQVEAARRSFARRSETAPIADTPKVDDWHEFGTEVIREMIANPERRYTVNPPFDEKRRIAASQFRPSDAPVKREIWDYVEKDQIGRTILRSGSFFRILDDPSAVNRDIFETFEQHMIFFSGSFARAPPKQLPWVNEVRQQYAYLRLREEQRGDADAFQ
jgi:hypothetical protein